MQSSGTKELHCISPDQLLGQLPSNVPAFLLPSLSFLLPHPSHNIKYSHQTLRDVLQSSSVGQVRDSVTHVVCECDVSTFIFHVQDPFLRVELLEVPEECANPLTLSISSPLTGSRAELHIPIDNLTLLHLDFPLEEVGVVLWTAVKKQFEAVTTAMLWKVRLLSHRGVFEVLVFLSSPTVCTMWQSTTSLPPPPTSVPSPFPTPTAPWRSLTIFWMVRSNVRSEGLPPPLSSQTLHWLLFAETGTRL